MGRRSWTEHTSFATVVINLSSWEIMITPPFHFWSTDISASRPYITNYASNSLSSYRSNFLPRYQDDSSAKRKIRWLDIGGVLRLTSSRSSTWGFCSESTEKATRDFCPPLRVEICWRLAPLINDPANSAVAKDTYPVIPLIWKLPKCERYSCSLFPGNFEARNWTGLMLGVRVSTWCCAKYPLWWNRALFKTDDITKFTKYHSHSETAIPGDMAWDRIQFPG